MVRLKTTHFKSGGGERGGDSFGFGLGVANGFEVRGKFML